MISRSSVFLVDHHRVPVMVFVNVVPCDRGLYLPLSLSPSPFLYLCHRRHGLCRRPFLSRGPYYLSPGLSPCPCPCLYPSHAHGPAPSLVLVLSPAAASPCSCFSPSPDLGRGPDHDP